MSQTAEPQQRPNQQGKHVISLNADCTASWHASPSSLLNPFADIRLLFRHADGCVISSLWILLRVDSRPIRAYSLSTGVALFLSEYFDDFYYSLRDNELSLHVRPSSFMKNIRVADEFR